MSSETLRVEWRFLELSGQFTPPCRHQTQLCLVFLRAMNPVVRNDILVSAFLDSVGGYRHKERRDHLLDILDVDLDWRMHAISDGERRRVQLCMGLMAPWDVLLLDEVNFVHFAV